MTVYHTKNLDADWRVAVVTAVLCCLTQGDEVVCEINPVAERELGERIAAKYRKRVKFRDGFADARLTDEQRLADVLHDPD